MGLEANCTAHGKKQSSLKYIRQWRERVRPNKDAPHTSGD